MYETWSDVFRLVGGVIFLAGILSQNANVVGVAYFCAVISWWLLDRHYRDMSKIVDVARQIISDLEKGNI